MEEIKAGDIMLGNYITDIHSPKGFFKVTEIHKKTVRYGFDYKARYEDLRGIPLTEDILLKADCTKETEDDKYGRVFLIPNTRYIIRIVNYGNPWNKDFGFSLELSDDRDWVNIKRLYYVHDFQNTIKSLTGNDLKIEV